MTTPNLKIALVTGANRGIGLAVAKGLLQEGFTTILTSRTLEGGQQAVEQLRELGQLHYCQLDVTDPNSIEAAADYVRTHFSRLDVLINNAGINYDTWQDVLSPDFDTVQETLTTNLIGPWRLCQAMLPLMQEHGYGRVVNVSSGAGALQGMSAGTPAYGISKAALNALTIKLGARLEGSGILVNAVCPGWVRTDMGGQNADRSPEEGADGIIWAAQLPDDGPTGKFFRDRTEIHF